MPQFYLVKDIGGGFDGLVVEGTPLKDSPPTVRIERIIDRNANVGDRTVSLPIPLGSLFIGQEFLEPTDDPGTREFASNNPFGQLVLEGHMQVGDLKVSYAQFQAVLSVNVRELTTGKTLFSQYFSKDFEKVKSTIEDVLKQNADSDPDDLVLKLRALKEAENHG